MGQCQILEAIIASCPRYTSSTGLNNDAHPGAQTSSPLAQNYR
jgi:hypothetical protein